MRFPQLKKKRRNSSLTLEILLIHDPKLLTKEHKREGEEAIKDTEAAAAAAAAARRGKGRPLVQSQRIAPLALVGKGASAEETAEGILRLHRHSRCHQESQCHC